MQVTPPKISSQRFSLSNVLTRVAHRTKSPSAPEPLEVQSPLAQPAAKTYFLHVLKTGGVTFRKILEQLYGETFQVCYDPTAESIASVMQTAECMEFHSFHFEGKLNHMHGELLRQDRLDILDGQNVFTMLRDPIDHVVSFYYFLQRRRLFLEPVYHARGLRWPETFEEFLEAPYHFNLQTAFLANRHQLTPETVANGDDLTVAKYLLDRLKVHVGLTERFAESVHVLEQVTGRRLPKTEIQSENRNPDRLPLDAIPAKLKDRIRENSALDIELYQFGQQMFREDLAKCGPTRSYTFLDSKLGDDAAVGAKQKVWTRVATATKSANGAAASPVAVTGRVAFLHVMKTGGMTFRNILASIYGDGFHVVNDPTPGAIETALKRYEALEFHTLPYGGDFVHMHSELARRGLWHLLDGADVFTMLRDPVDQVVSQYFYMVKERAHIEPAYKANGVRFPESIEEYIENPAHMNNQLAFLVGKYRLKPGNDVTGADLENASKMMVELGVHPGLTERFTESLHIFETVTGRRVSNVRIQNKNHARPPLEAISAEIKAMIRKKSALDIALYDFARAIFMRDVAQCGAPRQYSFVDNPVLTSVKPPRYAFGA